MSMLDLFAGRGFKASKCKTLLKLTIPRIKLLRNRREVQIKQMRREIAKLLETGQEATARIRVEHIVREEKMMAAQEILELFSELIAVRLPVIEAQRECPLDLKEAISSVCFAAPRCGDLTELQQIPMLFASKYGNEFVAAATELRPDCGVNRKLVELLSVRAPSAETKLKLLKEIAEEHELDWDPADTETEFFKNHEDLLDGTKRFVSGSKLPLPEEKHEETLLSASDSVPNVPKPETDDDFDELDFPEVPNVSLRPKPSSITTPTVSAPPTASSHLESEHELLNHAPAVSPHLENEHELPKHAGAFEYVSPYSNLDSRNVSDENLVGKRDQETPVAADAAKVEKQFLAPISPPYVASESLSVKSSDSPPTRPKEQSGAAVDLQDVLAAAYTAAETAERAAAAARSVANLAQVRITELTEKSREKTPESMFENPFHNNLPKKLSSSPESPHLDHQNSGPEHQRTYRTENDDHPTPAFPDVSSFEKLKLGPESPVTTPPLHGPDAHQPQRLPSMDDEPYFSYPNLFTSQNPNPAAGSHLTTDDSKAKYDP